MRQLRTYQAAQQSRLTADWIAGATTADQEVYGAIRLARARSRDLYRNNDYVKKFAHMVEQNVVGPQGILIQARAAELDGRPDVAANALIEDGWKTWCCSMMADVSGRQSFHDLQRMFIRTVAIDGECFVRIVRGFPNDYGLALQFIESDRLDENHNAALPGGGEIRMGIELDQWSRAVAYHVRSRPTGVQSYYTGAGAQTVRIPAAEMLHAYIVDRVDQTRGMPWAHTAMSRLRQLGGYEEAELIAARIAASKMGFYKRTGDGGSGVLLGDDTDDSGNLIKDASPGTFEELPVGYDLASWAPDHPVGNYGQFVKSCLRGISSGLGVAYTSLANDLEGVNYSSIRSGLLDERDRWRVLQGWTIQHLVAPVFEAWLAMALLTGALPLPVSKFEKFRKVHYQPRGWQWIDPLKDTDASIAAVGAGFKTRAAVVAEQGEDLEDVYIQLAKEDALAKQYGLNLSIDRAPAPTAQAPAPQGDDDRSAHVKPPDIHIGAPVINVMAAPRPLRSEIVTERDPRGFITKLIKQELPK
ncbi:MAG: phage portal protein [Gammaproteobacteria bacterium]